MPLYFAYGSNLDAEQMKRRCPESRIITTGCLRGFCLNFTWYSSGWGGGVADVVIDPQREVWGLIYELTERDLKLLDYYEGYPKFYTRFQTSIKTSERIFNDVWVYEVVSKNAFIPPTRLYLEIIKRGA